MSLDKNNNLRIVRSKFELKGIEENAENSNELSQGEIMKPWPKVQFGISNKFLRSAIFGVQREKREGILETFTFLYQNQMEITFSGPLLNQDDSIIWQAVLQAVKNSDVPLGGSVRLRKIDVLKHLGKTTAGKNYSWLLESLDRLSLANVKCVQGKDIFRSSLISGYRLNLDQSYVNVGISSYLEPLLSEDLTDIDIIRKSKLTSQLSRWLHDFYSSHTNPIPYKIEKLKTLCRSNQPLAKFKMSLKKSVEDLKNCEPPLFSQDSFLDTKSNTLHVFKETGSPYVPAVKKQNLVGIVEDKKKTIVHL